MFQFYQSYYAGALGRAKETGVQKVLGARQSQLIRKFFTESFLMCFFLYCIACNGEFSVALFQPISKYTTLL